jgi:micrococcal nuclease
MRRLGIILGAALIAAPALAQIRVIDGDTIARDGVSYRIAGIDAPEVSRPRCLAEAKAGRRATEVFRGLIDRFPVRIEPLSVRDRWGRSIARVYVREVNVADLLIKHGLAVAYCPHPRRCERRPDWCELLKGTP